MGNASSSTASKKKKKKTSEGADAASSTIIRCSGQSLQEWPPEALRGAPTELWFDGNDFESLPASFDVADSWRNVQLLYIQSSHRLKALDNQTCSLLADLEELNISQTGVTLLPESAQRWTRLKSFYCHDIPSFGAIDGATLRCWGESLRVLSIENCALEELPEDGVAALVNVRQVILNGNRLTRLPPSVGAWRHVMKLFVNNNALESLPPEIARMSALQQLHVSSNRLTALPDEIGELAELRDLYANDNAIAELTPRVGALVELNKLYLMRNALTELPEQLVERRGTLELLYVSGNRLETLPEWIGQLAKLLYLDVADNRIAELPPTLVELGALRSISLQGNPCIDEQRQIDTLDDLKDFFSGGGLNASE
jgi:Leucine-rich repeat (LRR) protein